MIKESVERNKIRRACSVQNGATKAISTNGNLPINNDGDLYENTNPLLLDQIKQQSFANQVNGVQSLVPFGSTGEARSDSKTSANKEDQQAKNPETHSETTDNNNNEQEQSITASAKLRLV